MFGLSPAQVLVVGVVAIMLFGSRLPEVARNLGRQYRDLRRQLNDVQDQFRMAEREVTRAFDEPLRSLNQPHSSKSAPAADDDADDVSQEPSVPKFTPPPSDQQA